MLDIQNFLSFNSKLHQIIAQLRLCGDHITDVELIEKTLSTFPPATVILHQQYHNTKFRKYFQLMSHHLLAEKHQQLLIRNAEARPIRDIHTTIFEIHASEAPERPPLNFKQRQPFKTRYTLWETPCKSHQFHS